MKLEIALVFGTSTIVVLLIAAGITLERKTFWSILKTSSPTIP